MKLLLLLFFIFMTMSIQVKIKDAKSFTSGDVFDMIKLKTDLISNFLGNIESDEFNSKKLLDEYTKEIMKNNTNITKISNKSLNRTSLYNKTYKLIRNQSLDDFKNQHFNLESWLKDDNTITNKIFINDENDLVPPIKNKSTTHKSNLNVKKIKHHKLYKLDGDSTNILEVDLNELNFKDAKLLKGYFIYVSFY